MASASSASSSSSSGFSAAHFTGNQLKERRKALASAIARINAALAAGPNVGDATRLSGYKAALEQKIQTIDAQETARKALAAATDARKKAKKADWGDLDRDIAANQADLTRLESQLLTPLAGGGASVASVVELCQPVLSDPALGAAVAAVVPVCETGKHTESLAFPTVPAGESSVAARLVIQKQCAREAGNEDDPGDKFERQSAVHDVINTKDLAADGGAGLSRKLTNAEKAQGGKGTDQFVRAVCATCGRWREIDHVSNSGDIVECKDKDNLKDDEDKMIDNAEWAKKNNKKVIYKLSQHCAKHQEKRVMDVFKGQGAADKILVVPVANSTADLL